MKEIVVQQKGKKKEEERKKKDEEKRKARKQKEEKLFSTVMFRGNHQTFSQKELANTIQRKANPSVETVNI